MARTTRLPLGRWLAVLLLIASCAMPASVLAQARESFLQPMGPVSQEQSAHLLRVIGMAMIVILPVLIGVPLILWRYRYAGAKGRYEPRWEFSKPLEFALWGVPMLVVAMLAGWLWHSTQKLDPYASMGPDPLRVQAIGLDWKWVFIYPDQGIATVNELALPVGRPIEMTLTTDTVMQSLLIAPLTGQIYAMPGMRTKLNFSAVRPGVAEGENTQFNGNGFGRQKFTVRALGGNDFTAWTKRSRDVPLNEATYATLRRRSVLAQARRELGLGGSAQPITMALEGQDVFDKIIAKYHRDGKALTARWGGTGMPQDSGSHYGSSKESGQ
ncbi:cytochrome ubiquinol oxidase subunit II family protein [Novosphingobium aquimarinum]|uniref:cytochrome ubiquinol oxidase subunit II n=1 Tax=Novosphingobium aquimarinum TaxID=2682494 RepID=UPI0012EC1900|nr:cytochrome ubiquinol oxidase subunit II [Novosphingobium aquimarinum]